MSHPGRRLPPLNALLERRRVRGLQRRLRRDVLVQLLRELLAEERNILANGKGLKGRYGSATPDRDQLLRFLEARAVSSTDELLAPKLASVINATGVLLHTNLGRAQLGEAALKELARVARQPVALEIDLQTGNRGSRLDRIDRWLRLLTGAQAGLAVNNGAAALWLAVQGLAARRQAVISRGEQVAIGGSFRMPELLRTTSAKVVEVGTTNKTKLSDYAKVLRKGDVVVKVHPSNYRIEGFTEEVTLDQLGQLCRRREAALVFDAGSGSLYNFGRFGLEGETPVSEALQQGAQVVTFSGDKLLGGPQAGLLVGDDLTVRKLSRHPMMRALRLDKLVLAALESTLAAYASPGRQPPLPLFSALSLSKSMLRRRAQALAATLRGRLPAGWRVEIKSAEGAVGGGSFAERPLESVALLVGGPEEAASERLHTRLRRTKPAILTGIGGGFVRIDMRTPHEHDLDMIAERIISICGEEGSRS